MRRLRLRQKIIIIFNLMFWSIVVGCLTVGSRIVLAETVQYGYDDLYQALSATYDDGSVVSLDYDAVGNRTIQNVAPAIDTDSDGLSDYLENLLGTTATNADTDQQF